MGTLISGLKGLAHDTELAINAFCLSDTQPTKGEYTVLTALSARFSKVAERFADQVNELKEKRARWAREEGEKLVSAAESAAAELTEKGRPKSLATFRKNITLIFEGPKESNLDSASDKSRHKLTRKRCEQIRNVKPNGILVWAAAFPPTTWTAGFMNNVTFDYLIAEIASKDTDIFPENIRQIMHTFGSEAPLKDSKSYGEFIGGKCLIGKEDEQCTDGSPAFDQSFSTAESTHSNKRLCMEGSSTALQTTYPSHQSVEHDPAASELVGVVSKLPTVATGRRKQREASLFVRHY